MQTIVIALRILRSIRYDKRTLALILVAPLLIMFLIFSIFTDTNYNMDIGIINGSKAYISELKEANEDLNIHSYSKKEAIKAIENQEIIAAINQDNDNIDIYIDGSQVSKAEQIKSLIEGATKKWEINKKLEKLPTQLNININESEITKNIEYSYIYGNKDLNMFDSYGAAFLGIIIYFLVFLISGINFLTERNSGTLEKILSTPTRPIHIIGGYILGYSILAFVQSIVITLFVVYVLGLQIVGFIGAIVFIVLLTAISALTLGLLLSTLANSEFQMMQFIPIVILPQIFLCGIFTLNSFWENISQIMPMYYVVDALKNMILLGKDLMGSLEDIGVLAGVSIFFFILNIIILKKQQQK